MEWKVGMHICFGSPKLLQILRTGSLNKAPVEIGLGRAGQAVQTPAGGQAACNPHQHIFIGMNECGVFRGLQAMPIAP
jgi:hypothetical protein